MSIDPGFTCSSCGERHTELPMSYSAAAPDVWNAGFEADADSMLSSDQCVIKGHHFFIRGMIEIPVIGSTDIFSWGVWVSLSRDDFTRALDVWNAEGREAEKPYFGWLSTELALYSEGTADLKTNAHTRPVGKRFSIELEPTGHPLAVEQRTGITRERVREIAMAVLHPA
ncbi:DUF2199 domain-containing protein [Streptomyces sp. H27-H1]|uniref:DUF2199 domain-containing protein n=1 Tax=Streptomyces sp. H27-H1 TaxID=2996461 RepID=UPI00226DA2D7|nr:DUF2199 domain-containing protein [Streptomyces sp. H27-H1]MCY0925713.1 DUF2199 domain-containing protein [Streptomyces sp. H27-H1]